MHSRERSWLSRPGAAMVALCLASGCVTTSHTRVTSTAERREWVVVANGSRGPLETSFQREGGSIRGEVTSKVCALEGSQVRTTLGVKRRHPNRDIGLALAILGATALTWGTLARMNGWGESGCIGESECENRGVGYGTTGAVTYVAGAMALATGLTLALVRPEENVTVLSRRRETWRKASLCIPPSVLHGTKLGVQLPDGSQITGFVSKNGEIEIPLDPNTALPDGAVLPVVVVSPPLGSDKLRRGEVVGTFVVSSLDAPAPASAMPP